jgi:hypothetical protein
MNVFIFPVLKIKKTGIGLFLISMYMLSSAGYGDIQDGLPSRMEREALTMTSAVRMDPVGFRDKYITSTTILLPANYPAVGPVWYNHNLNKASRFHSTEMANTCGMQHNSCDGTTFDVRLKSYYTSSGWIGENVATGVATGIGTVIQWLRDDNAQKVPAADNDADGHRKNIMNTTYHEMGNGYAYSATRQWNYFWTQDFGGGAGSDYKIPSGTHFLAPSNTTTLFFAANYYDKSGSPPSKPTVAIDGVESAMTLHLGKEAAGTYIYSIPNDKKAHCYYFHFTDATGTLVRYPQTTNLSTVSDSACVSAHIYNKRVSRIRQNSNSTFSQGACFYQLNGEKVKSLSAKNSEQQKGVNGVFLYSTSAVIQKKLNIGLTPSPSP